MLVQDSNTSIAHTLRFKQETTNSYISLSYRKRSTFSMFKWRSCAVSLLYKEAFWCGLIKIDTNTAGLICIWLASYLFMHNMNDGLEVSFINQTHHIKKQQTLTCFHVEANSPLGLWLRGSRPQIEIQKWRKSHLIVSNILMLCVCGVWEHIVCLCCVGKTTCLLFCWYFSFLDSQAWKSENLCWTLVIIMFYFLKKKMHIVVENSMLFILTVTFGREKSNDFRFSALRAGSFPFAGKNLHFSILMWNHCARATEKVCMCLVWECQCRHLYFDTSCPDGCSLIRSIMFPARLSCAVFLFNLLFSQHTSHCLLFLLFLVCFFFFFIFV